MDNAEKKIILKIKRGDKKAFDGLFENHFEDLCNYAFLLVRDETAAEEIVTEVFFRLWCKRNEIHIRVSVKKYLLKSVYNISLNYLKHLGIVKQYKELSIVMHKEKEIISGDYSTSPLALLEYNELKEIVQMAIDNLPDQCRRVFTMNRFEGKRYTEIARELDISLSTVKYHMSTALNTLKDKLNEFLGQ